jgi:hypothetical protein
MDQKFLKFTAVKATLLKNFQSHSNFLWKLSFQIFNSYFESFKGMVLTLDLNIAICF